MKQAKQIRRRALLLLAAIVALCITSTQLRGDTGNCNGGSITLPFTDVPESSVFFCAIASAYLSGLTDGTSATTFSPAQNVKREEIADFASRSLGQSLARGSRRAALDQWWTQAVVPSTSKTPVGVNPDGVKSDGADVWVAGGGLSRVRASDGRLLETWTGPVHLTSVLVARGRVFATGHAGPLGALYSIDPTQPAGVVTLVTDKLGSHPVSIAYDGSRIWTANVLGGVSIYKFICVTGGCVTTVTAGFGQPRGILYDGSNIWVTDGGDKTLKKLNSNGSIASIIPMDFNPEYPVFDGSNIWVPNAGSHSVTVVRVKDSTGNPLAQPFVLATLTGNGLDTPIAAAFDGQRVLVTNQWGGSVSLWKAQDLTPLGSFSTGTNSHPLSACSDGINFWIGLNQEHKVARF